MAENIIAPYDCISRSYRTCSRPEERRAWAIWYCRRCAADFGGRVGSRAYLGFPQGLASGTVEQHYQSRKFDRLVYLSNRRKELVALKKLKKLMSDTSGDAVVEATILFPIMIMIFAALILLAMYLPQRTILQEAAQFTAIALATEISDTYVAFDNQGNRVAEVAVENVYVSTIKGILGSGLNAEDKAYSIANHLAGKGIISVSGEVQVELEATNYVIYQEITVKLTQSVPLPVDLSFIGFPTEIVLVQEASAVVQNGDEFVRNIDIAKDMVIWLDNKFEISKTLEEALGSIGDVVGKFNFGGG